MLLNELALIASVLLLVSLVHQSRGGEGTQRGYVMVLALVLGIAVTAIARGSGFLAIVAVCMTSLVVVVPWVLELLARVAFSRSRLRWGVACTGLRTLLMPGAGLSRQQSILHGLAVLERDGVDEAIGHFRGLAHGTDDGVELALINEQIVSMLLYGQRWGEGIAFFESHFSSRYAAARPALALGLVRAYGESGALERAAGLLRALEEGPVGADPRALGVLSQARLTFLAYAGAIRPVSRALTAERCRLLGLSLATGALFRGIALQRGGKPGPAQQEFERVSSLATTRDERVVAASRRAIEALGPDDVASVELDADVHRYVDTVAARLEGFLHVAPSLQRSGRPLATPLLVALIVATYAALRLLPAGGAALLQIGALTPPLWQRGDVWRVFSGIAVVGDPVGVAVTAYSLWLTGPVLERALGASRTLVVGLGGAMLGLLVAVSATSAPTAVFAGGHLMAASVAAGALAALRGGRGGSASRGRPTLTIPLWLVLSAQWLAAVPGLSTLDVPPFAIAASTVFGVVVSLRSRNALRWRRIATWVAAVLGLAFAGATLVSTSSDPDELATVGGTHRVAVGERWVTLPVRFQSLSERVVRSDLPLPLEPGAIDRLALRARHQVQLVPVPVANETDEQVHPLLRLDPVLARELSAVPQDESPEVLGEELRRRGAADPGGVVTTALRRNGETVGLVFAGEFDGWQVLVSPPDALEPELGAIAELLLAAPSPPR